MLKNTRGDSIQDRIAANSLMPSLTLVLLYSTLNLRELEKVIFQNLLTIGFLLGSTSKKQSYANRRWERGGDIFLVPDSGSGRYR